MIFDLRVPESLAALPGRRHYLTTSEDERDDMVRKCRICLYTKTVDQFRDKKDTNGKVYRRHECRECERKANNMRKAEKNNAP